MSIDRSASSAFDNVKITNTTREPEPEYQPDSTVNHPLTARLPPLKSRGAERENKLFTVFHRLDGDGA